jgi:CDGSH iron-sulfur domain-containing protein 3
MQQKEPEVEIVVRSSGPYRVYGPVRVVDADGTPYELERKRIPGGDFVALCRCGGSSTKPFCDGSHKRNGFEACERVSDPEWKTGPGNPSYREPSA